MNTLTKNEIEALIRALLRKHNVEYALLFGSYARGEATVESEFLYLPPKSQRYLHPCLSSDVGSLQTQKYSSL